MIILKLEYFCFVHFFVHRTVSRFEDENVVISEMKEKFSFCEIFGGILILSFGIQGRLRAAAPVRWLSSPFSYLRHTKVVKGWLQFVHNCASDPLENSQTEKWQERRLKKGN